MPGGVGEGSPLLGGAADPARDWGDADRNEFVGRHALRLGGEVRGKSTSSRRTIRRPHAGGALLRRHWRLSAAAAGALAFSMALAGLAGVFSAVKGEGSPRDGASSALQMEEAGGGKAPAAPEGKDRCESSGVLWAENHVHRRTRRL